MFGDTQVTDIWHDYQIGLDYLNSVNLFSKVETCFNFMNGDQWNGLKYGTERPPMLNILQPMMKSSTALVGHNRAIINHTSLNYGAARERLLEICRLLDMNAQKNWEKMKLDKVIWDVLQDAYIAGDSFLYFYDDEAVPEGSILCEQIDTTNIMFGDEQQPDIQKQPYILIIQRKDIKDVKEMARLNGCSEEEIDSIQPDSDTELQINGDLEVRNHQKLTVVAKMWKQDGFVHIARATKTVLIQPDTEIPLHSYPIAKYTWKLRKGLARGDGDTWDKIPNQISINKALYRLEQSVKNTSYPIKIYRQGAITPDQIDRLNQPGASIAVKGSPDQGIPNIISYLQPASVNGIAITYWQQLMQYTRDLSGTGDNLENVNPEQASGVAIAEVRAAKELNSNMQTAYYKQFIEDIANIWYEMLVAYNPDGVVIYDEDDIPHLVTQQELISRKVSIKITIVSTDATYVALKDANLKELFTQGAITFEEYVGSLDDTSSLPVAELQNIVKERQIRAQQNRAMGNMYDPGFGAMQNLQGMQQQGVETFMGG